MKNLNLEVITVLTILFNVEANENDVLKQLSINVGRKFLKCQHVMEYAPAVLTDFLNYWADRELNNYETGCAILCVGYELHLLDPNGKLHIPNAQGFLMAGGAEEPMTKSMLELSKKCILKVIPKRIKDICLIALEFAKCFRTEIRDLEWVPDVSDLMEVETRRSIQPPMRMYDDVILDKDNKARRKENTTIGASFSAENKRDDDLMRVNTTNELSGETASSEINRTSHSTFMKRENIKKDINKSDNNTSLIKIATIAGDDEKVLMRRHQRLKSSKT